MSEIVSLAISGGSLLLSGAALWRAVKSDAVQTEIKLAVLEERVKNQDHLLEKVSDKVQEILEECHGKT